MTYGVCFCSMRPAIGMIRSRSYRLAAETQMLAPQADVLRQSSQEQ